MKTKTTGLAAGLALVATGAPAATLIDTGLTRGDNQWAILGKDRVDSGGTKGHYRVAWAAPFTLTSASRITGLEAGLCIYEGGGLSLAVFDAATGFPETSAPLINVVLSLSTLDNRNTYPNVDWQGATNLNTSLPAKQYWFGVIPTPGSIIFAGLGRLPASPLPGFHLADSGPTGWGVQQRADYFFDVRISGEAIGGSAGPAIVPEPGSWAMLITGFGLTGFSLRQRRRASAHA